MFQIIRQLFGSKLRNSLDSTSIFNVSNIETEPENIPTLTPFPVLQPRQTSGASSHDVTATVSQCEDYCAEVRRSLEEEESSSEKDRRMNIIRSVCLIFAYVCVVSTLFFFCQKLNEISKYLIDISF